MPQKIDFINMILPKLAEADEKSLYRILSKVGRAKRREVLRKFDDVITGENEILKNQPSGIRESIKKKFSAILAHYKYENNASNEETGKTVNRLAN